MSTYYIASLKHTNRHHAHIVWWARFERGYTPVVGPYIGAYCYGEACRMNDGRDFIAVPAEAVRRLLSPEPYFRPGARFYDQRGPVANNTRAVWDELIAARLLPEGEQFKPKPEVFRGKWRVLAEDGSAVSADRRVHTIRLQQPACVTCGKPVTHDHMSTAVFVAVWSEQAGQYRQTGPFHAECAPRIPRKDTP